MTKKVSVRVWVFGSNDRFYRRKKVEVSKTSKKAIADLFENEKKIMKEKGDKLKEIYFIFDEGV